MKPLHKLFSAIAFFAFILISALALLRFLGLNPLSQNRPAPLTTFADLTPDPRLRPHVFPTAQSRWHHLGHADGAGWAATPTDKTHDHMNFGPYTSMIAPGPNVATFRIMVDKLVPDDTQILNLDINDSTADKVLGELPVLRNQFKQPGVYQDFNLPFIAPLHGRLEFRTYYLGQSYVNQQSVTITPYASSTWIFPTADSPYHRTGHRDDAASGGGGWTATPSDPANDYLNYGPYTRVIPAGENTASFRLMIDNNTIDDAPIADLDVRDAQTNSELGAHAITRSQFKQPGVYQDFDLIFQAPRGNPLEFRTFFRGGCTLTQQQVSITPAIVPTQNPPH